VVTSFLALGRIDEAEQASKEMEKLNPDSTGAHDNRFLFSFLRRDQAGMDRELEWARGKPEEVGAVIGSANIAAYYGKMKQSEELVKRAAEMFKTQNRAENAEKELLSLAANQVVVGKFEQAKENSKAAQALNRGRSGLAGAALMYAACGDVNQAQTILAQLRAKYPSDTILNSIFSPVIQAMIEYKRGNLAEAVRLMESVQAYDRGLVTGLMNNYFRGSLYLEQRRGPEAAAEFKKIIDNPGIEFFSPAHALAYLGMGRAAAISGDTTAARKSYQDFFALWKDADPDLPVLVQARKEYEALR
jgi:tetratricopeptide (TPR) repeat protein